MQSRNNSLRTLNVKFQDKMWIFYINNLHVSTALWFTATTEWNWLGNITFVHVRCIPFITTTLVSSMSFFINRPFLPLAIGCRLFCSYVGSVNQCMSLPTSLSQPQIDALLLTRLSMYNCPCTCLWLMFPAPDSFPLLLFPTGKETWKSDTCSLSTESIKWMIMRSSLWNKSIWQWKGVMSAWSPMRRPRTGKMHRPDHLQSVVMITATATATP